MAALAGVTQQDVINVPWRGEGLSFEHIRAKIADVITFGVLVLLPLLGVLAVLAIGAFAAKPATRGAKMAKPNLIAPFALAFVGIPMILLGIAASALNSIDDLGLQGTVFEEGATVAVVYGAVAAGLAAVAYWIPKLTGRTLPTKAVAGLAPLALLAAALASIPYFVAGFADQPASAAVYSNDGPGELLNVARGRRPCPDVPARARVRRCSSSRPCSVSEVRPRSADPAGDNPWDAHTLEWGTAVAGAGRQLRRHAHRHVARAACSTSRRRPTSPPLTSRVWAVPRKAELPDARASSRPRGTAATAGLRRHRHRVGRRDDADRRHARGLHQDPRGHARDVGGRAVGAPGHQTSPRCR